MEIQGPWFKDEHGRTLILRGVNLGGSSKVPFEPDGATYRKEGFFNHRQVSFVGRPFPLQEADEHFSRLRAWGLTFLRFQITWEAVEHAGPGDYDEGYLDYLRSVLEKADEHGIKVFIDPHQDVWSRFTGGDGAPGWTLEAVGLDMTKFDATEAAIVHQVRGDPFPRMIWPMNGIRLAAATMFALFFGGNDFAPATRVDGEPVQEFLQRHYLAAMQRVALTLKGLPNVVGYDTMNEPLRGYIGCQDLQRVEQAVMYGLMPTPLQGMLLGAGFPQRVEKWELRLGGPKLLGHEEVNQGKERAWFSDAVCVWRENGVWGLNGRGEPQLLRPDHFHLVKGREVSFAEDYYLPFANRFASIIRSADPDAIIFIESETDRPALTWGPGDAERIVFAPHWYDAYVLFMKNYHPLIAVDTFNAGVVLGRRRIRKSFAAQLGYLKRIAAEQLGAVPTLIGEFGIAYDMKGKQAYRTGDFSAQVKALDRSFRAMEDNLLSCTLWNYTADNTNRHGDKWNDEDLSIFSRDQQSDVSDIHSGGRALEAAVRPYASKIAGEPLRMSFDLRRKVFVLEFRHDEKVAEPTEIFVPGIHFPAGSQVEVSDGTYAWDVEKQILVYRHTQDVERHMICIRGG